MTKTQAKYEEIKKLQRELAAISQAEFKPGTKVWWMRNGRRQEGVVVWWAYGRSCVENSKTRKQIRKDTVELNLRW